MRKLSSKSENFRVLDYLDDAVIITDINLRVEYHNKSAENLYGVISNRISGKSIYELFSVDECSLMREEILSIVNNKGFWSSELVHILNNGERVWVEWKIKKKESELSDSGYVFIIRNINKEKQEELSAKKNLTGEEVFLQNERYTRILDRLPAIVFVADIKTHEILYANKHTKELLGDAIGKTCHKLLRNKDNPCENCFNSQLLDRQGNPLGVIEAETIYSRLDKWYAIRDQAIFWDENRMAVLEIAFDITPQKETEDALKTSKSRYRQIVETANEGIWILDEENKTLYANKKMSEMLGVTLEQLKQGSIFQYIDENWQKTFLSEISKLNHGKAGQFDFRFIRQDGYSLWVIVSCTPIFDDNKQRNGTLLMITDITNRKQAENALLESEERLVKAQRVAHIGYWELDIDSSVVWASDELFNIYGMTQISPYVPLNELQNCIHREDRKRIEHALLRLTELGDIYDEQFRIVKAKDGKIRKVHSRANIVVDKSNKPVKISGTIQDITDIKDLEERLQQSQKMEAIGRLAGGVAHDFNNLLTGISINVSLAMMEIDSVDPIYETLEEVHRGVDRAADLTRQLLTFSRKQLIVPKVININNLIDNIHKMLVRVLGEDIELILRLKKRLGRVKTDPGQMEQIIVNLAVNARDAMPDGGKLIIETDDVVIDDSRKYHELGATPGKYVKIAVSDTGSGMDKEIQSHIFEPFFTTKSMGRGTGLGLATVYGIINQHGGFISVNSEVGKGTIFEIFFPKVSDKAEDIELAKVEKHLPTGSETILFVEDDPIVRMIAVKMLKKLNYNVLEAESGEKALEICNLNDSDIDLLLTDIVMPGMNGWQLAEKIIKTGRDVKMIFSSGYTENLVGNEYITKQGVNFIGKPYTPKVLAQKVRDVLDKN